MNNTIVSSTISPSTYTQARFGQGRVSVPVTATSPAAQFEYVRGVPSRDDGAGISVNRLFVLNSVLRRYAGGDDRVAAGELAGDMNASRAAGSPDIGVPSPSLTSDAIAIESDASMARPYANVMLEPGLIFSITT